MNDKKKMKQLMKEQEARHKELVKIYKSKNTDMNVYYLNLNCETASLERVEVYQDYEAIYRDLVALKTDLQQKVKYKVDQGDKLKEKALNKIDKDIDAINSKTVIKEKSIKDKYKKLQELDAKYSAFYELLEDKLGSHYNLNNRHSFARFNYDYNKAMEGK